MEKKNRVQPQPTPKKSAAKKHNSVAEDRLELLFTVVNRGKAEFYVDLLSAFDINMQTVVLASGTANAKMLEYFGLTDTEKAVIISAVKISRIPDVLATLDEKFKTIKNGKGIAYTVPMTGVIGTLIFGFLSNNRLTVKQTEETK